MKITFLGSSHGVPSAERFCSCAMVEVGKSIYLIDAGAPVADLLIRYKKDMNDLKAVFTTHRHGDHTDGLLSLTDLCTWYFKATSFDIFITDKEIEDAVCTCVEVMCKPVDKERIRYRLAAEGEVYDDGKIKVTYIPTRHCEPTPSYAVLVEAEGKRVLFTGDLSRSLAKNDFPMIATKIHTELVVCELAHFGIEHVEPYMKLLKTDNLCFNHVNPRNTFEEIEAINSSGEYPYSISYASDGDVFEF